MTSDTTYEEQFMLRAIELSEMAYITRKGLPVGCVIVKDGKIVGEGYNATLSSKNPTAHAEMMAIQEACRQLNESDLSTCQLYTTLEPCPMCKSAIVWARLGTVYFANTKEDAVAFGFSRTIDTEKPVPAHHISNIQAIQILKEWQSHHNL